MLLLLMFTFFWIDVWLLSMFLSMLLFTILDPSFQLKLLQNKFYIVNMVRFVVEE